MSFLINIWKNGRHEKLSEELALQSVKESENDLTQTDKINGENDIVTYKLKYLGSTVIEKTSGDNLSVEAVKSILKVAKAARKKLLRVNVAISLKGIAVTDLQGNDILKVSIYRISNCSTDASHRQIFSFISTDSNETTECHAFLCSKRKLAETVTLTVAHAFTTAYEAWRILPSTQEFAKNSRELERKDSSSAEDNNRNNLNNDEKMIQQEEEKENLEEKLIELDDEPGALVNIPSTIKRSRLQMQLQRPWVSFDEDLVAAEHRYNKTDLLIV